MSFEDDQADGDATAFRVECPTGRSPYLFTCDHASPRLPRRLGTLGLPQADLARHIAWDIGIAGVARRLSQRLDAFLILGGHSRLAIDLNRPPGAPDSIVTRSDHTDVPGNQALTSDEVARRGRELFHPYHDRIAHQLDERARAGRTTILVTLHSFTPALQTPGRADPRPWHAGVLYLPRAPRLGHLLLELLRQDPQLVVGDNQPYAAGDATDYTLVVHGERRGLPHVELELRQDLISDEAGQTAWADRLAVLLQRAHARMFPA